MNTCGNCKYYHPFNGEAKGECFLNPPMIYAFGQGSRPRVNAKDHPCSHHCEGAPVIKEKVQADTPGLAAKVAREKKRNSPTPVPVVATPGYFS